MTFRSLLKCYLLPEASPTTLFKIVPPHIPYLPFRLAFSLCSPAAICFLCLPMAPLLLPGSGLCSGHRSAPSTWCVGGGEGGGRRGGGGRRRVGVGPRDHLLQLLVGDEQEVLFALHPNPALNVVEPGAKLHCGAEGQVDEGLAAGPPPLGDQGGLTRPPRGPGHGASGLDASPKPPPPPLAPGERTFVSPSLSVSAPFLHFCLCLFLPFSVSVCLSVCLRFLLSPAYSGPLGLSPLLSVIVARSLTHLSPSL